MFQSLKLLEVVFSLDLLKNGLLELVRPFQALVLLPVLCNLTLLPASCLLQSSNSFDIFLQLLLKYKDFVLKFWNGDILFLELGNVPRILIVHVNYLLNLAHVLLVVRLLLRREDEFLEGVEAFLDVVWVVLQDRLSLKVVVAWRNWAPDRQLRKVPRVKRCKAHLLTVIMLLIRFNCPKGFAVAFSAFQRLTLLGLRGTERVAVLFVGQYVLVDALAVG